MREEIILDKVIGFQWDSGNRYKNYIKHAVTELECEQVFFNEPLLIVDDINHSKLEKRYYGLGKNDSGRRIFIVFTLRKDFIRVISARDMSRNERIKYEKQEKNT